jgi:2-dehydropantoate 2-reductase
MTEIQKIAIWGVGAMGAMYAARFHDKGFDVTVVAEGERAERLRRDGFYLNDKHYMPVVITPDDDHNPADLVIVALKQHHMANAMHQLAPVVGEHTLMLTVMNGLDSEPMLAEAYGAEKVLYCISVGMTPVRDGNRVTLHNWGKLIFGEAKNDTISDNVKRVQTAFDRAELTHSTPVDMLRELWWKFMVNVGVNQASAVLGTAYGEMRQADDARALMDDLMREVIAVAQAEGITLNEDDIAAWHKVFDTLDTNGKTSMLQDVEAGRQTEVDIFAGKVIELGQQHGIPTPINQTIYRILRVLQANPPGS